MDDAQSGGRRTAISAWNGFISCRRWPGGARVIARCNWQCGAGVGLSLLLLFGIAPAPVLFLLWCLYLSLSTVCGPFLDFQWDMLLLETGFLAIFFAPLQWVERPSRQAAPSSVVLWLLRWLMFRLMLESGCVKLMSGDRLVVESDGVAGAL